jgi:hypothetical protein
LIRDNCPREHLSASSGVSILPKDITRQRIEDPDERRKAGSRGVLAVTHNDDLRWACEDACGVILINSLTGVPDVFPKQRSGGHIVGSDEESAPDIARLT